MRHAIQAFAVLLALLTPVASRACGFGEAPGDCGGGSSDSEAKYMLHRVVAAVEADKAQALREFARGENGFRTVDTYVFCVGPDGVMTAHPSAMLQGQDVRALHDETGNYFIATMLKTAKPGEIAQIRYLFPRPGGGAAVAKTTYYTRAADQVCAVGVYDGDEVTAPSSTPTPAARMAMLRQRLGEKMPPALGDDWKAFLQALDEQTGAQAAAFAKARDQVHAAEAALSGNNSPAP
jgi:hypothetical protein